MQPDFCAFAGVLVCASVISGNTSSEVFRGAPACAVTITFAGKLDAMFTLDNGFAGALSAVAVWPKPVLMASVPATASAALCHLCLVPAEPAFVGNFGPIFSVGTPDLCAIELPLVNISRKFTTARICLAALGRRGRSSRMHPLEAKKRNPQLDVRARRNLVR